MRCLVHGGAGAAPMNRPSGSELSTYPDFAR
jgi:hypothetical protein